MYRLATTFGKRIPKRIVDSLQFGYYVLKHFILSCFQFQVERNPAVIL